MFASKQAEEFLAGCADPEATQLQVLRDKIIGPNVGSAFGSEHGFAKLDSLADYRAAVPIRKYSRLAPWIDRVVAGEQGVLTTERVKRFFMTSGSMAQAKYIPVTRSFIQTKSRAFGIYWSQVFADHPTAKTGRMVTNFSDSAKDDRVEGGLPCSSESAYWASVTRATQLSEAPIIPKSIARIADSESRYYALARILSQASFSVIMTLNPSTIVLLLQTLARRADELADDIAHGTLSRAVVASDEVHAAVGQACPADPNRAAQLRELAGQPAGVLAQELWPALSLAICWRSPMVAPYLQLLAPHFGARVAQRDYLMMASEAVMAIPLQDVDSGGVCAVGLHFYEFVPEDEYESASPTVLSPHELTVGQRYVVILSNGSGLYRYDIGDVVRVRDFVGRTPVFEFLHRAGRTCSLTGEKLTEDQVTAAMDAVARELSLPIESFTMAPAPEGFPRYVAYVELAGEADAAAKARVPAVLDAALAASNVEYGGKRSSQRLAAPELAVVEPGTFARRRAARIAGGASDSQIKPMHLTRDAAIADEMVVRERFVM